MQLSEQIEELDSAESFLELFDVEYDPEVIQHRRVQLLRLFHKNLEWAEDVTLEFTDYKLALTKAYCLLQQGDEVPLEVPDCGQCSECH